MTPADQDKARKKAALQKLREARKPDIKAATARMKEQKKDIAALKEQLRQGDKTVPELAAATGLPVMRYVRARRLSEAARAQAFLDLSCDQILAAASDGSNRFKGNIQDKHFRNAKKCSC